MEFQHLILSMFIVVLARPCAATQCQEGKQSVDLKDCHHASRILGYRPTDIFIPESSPATYGDCGLAVSGAKRVNLTRTQIDSTISKITGYCPSKTGKEFVESTEATVEVFIPRQAVNFETPACSDHNQPDYQKADCTAVYRETISPLLSQPVNERKYQDLLIRSKGTCQITIGTTDRSQLVVGPKELDSAIDKLLLQCNSKSASMNLKGRTATKDGSLFINIW